jgi:flagellar motor component MotA
MFADMTDPSNPFMATALLATLYGAIVADMWCLPIADRLHLKQAAGEINRTLIIDGVLMIPRVEEPDAGARDVARLSAAGEASRRGRARAGPGFVARSMREAFGVQDRAIRA